MNRGLPVFDFPRSRFLVLTKRSVASEDDNAILPNKIDSRNGSVAIPHLSVIV